MQMQNHLKFPYLSKPLIGNHPGINCFQRKTLCKVEYEEGDPLEYGLLLETCKRRNIQFYSIATGKIGKKKMKKNIMKYIQNYTLPKKQESLFQHYK